MPARLAVGLGLESGLETSRLISFAPSGFSFGIWFSRTRLQEGNRISAATAKVNHNGGILSNRREQAVFIEKTFAN
jgi:UDP-3-O-acyl-N-acetylglucosamine deacetylase